MLILVNSLITIKKNAAKCCEKYINLDLWRIDKFEDDISYVLVTAICVLKNTATDDSPFKP